MDAPPRGAVMLVCFAAGCCMIVGMLDVGLYLAKCFQPKHPSHIKIFPLAVDSIPFVAGVVILIKAKAVAGWISEKLDM
jgi:uncharacterized membrane protein SirB2